MIYYFLGDFTFAIPTFLLLLSTFIKRRCELTKELSRYSWVPFGWDFISWVLVFLNNYDVFSDSLAVAYGYAGYYVAARVGATE